MELSRSKRRRLISANVLSNLVIALHALSLLFWNFINTTAYHLADINLHLPLAFTLPASVTRWLEYSSKFKIFYINAKLPKGIQIFLKYI